MEQLKEMSRYKVEELPCSEIFCDPAFNCRGHIDKMKCMDLADDIKKRGLSFPIHVQPYNLRLGFKYRIISGHRRFIAIAYINKALTIPAVVRTDLNSEKDAWGENFRENIQREPLTLLQEAETVSKFIISGDSVNQVAERLGKSIGWVEPRRMLMSLPTFVRKAADEGLITQNHIKQLWNYRDDAEKLSEIIRTIKERTEAGDKRIVIKEERKLTDFASVRRPKSHEIDDFLEIVAGMVVNKLPDDLEEYFAARCLAWVQGHISQAQLFMSLRRECERLGLAFNPPPDVVKIMEQVVKS